MCADLLWGPLQGLRRTSPRRLDLLELVGVPVGCLAAEPLRRRSARNESAPVHQAEAISSREKSPRQVEKQISRLKAHQLRAHKKKHFIRPPAARGKPYSNYT